jgi:hypothetical protein
MNGAGTMGDRIQQRAIRMLVVFPDNGSTNPRPSIGGVDLGKRRSSSVGRLLE